MGRTVAAQSFFVPNAKIQLQLSEQQMTVTVAGPVRADDVIQVVETQYVAFGGERILWDLTAADVSQVAPTDFVRVARAVREHTAAGVQRKTAYAVADQAAFLAAWKFVYEAVRIQVRVEYNAFTDVRAAQRWLDQP